MKYLFITLAFLSGCTYDAGTIAPGQVFDCTDTRDGETFTIRSENLGQVRGGIGTDSCVSGFDDNGIPRQLCNASQTWLKCVKR